MNKSAVTYIDDFMFDIFILFNFKSLATNRGRSVMMSTAIALLVNDGPIGTIDCNVQNVVRSITCMYEQVNSLLITLFS